MPSHPKSVAIRLLPNSSPVSDNLLRSYATPRTGELSAFEEQQS
jgi:hypothetical protein